MDDVVADKHLLARQDTRSRTLVCFMLTKGTTLPRIKPGDVRDDHCAGLDKAVPIAAHRDRRRLRLFFVRLVRDSC